MRRLTWLLALGVLLVPAVVSCAGVGPAQSAAPSGGADDDDAAGPLTQVAAPDDLFLVARVRDPAGLLESVGGIDAPARDLRAALPGSVQPCARYADWHAPAEALGRLHSDGVSLDVHAVWSIGMTSRGDCIKRLGRAATRVEPGVYRIRGMDCVIADSLGATPARLVCGSSSDAVTTLLPYATRGFPAESVSDAALLVRLQGGPLQRWVVPQLSAVRLVLPRVIQKVLEGHPDLAGDEQFSRALTSAGYAMVEEGTSILRDLDSLEIRGSVDSSTPALEVVTELSLRGTSSGLVQRLRGFESAGAAPPAFARLPADTVNARFTQGLELSLWQAMAARIGPLAKAVPGDLRKLASEVVDSPCLKPGTIVIADGSTPQPADRGGEELASWFLVGWHDPDRACAASLHRLLAAAGTQQARRALASALEMQEHEVIQPKRRKETLPGLPRGSTVLYHVVSGEPGTSGETTTYLGVMRDEQQTWLGIAWGKQDLVARLSGVRHDASGPAGRLGTPGAPLDGAKLTSGSRTAGLGFIDGMLGALQSLIGIPRDDAVVAVEHRRPRGVTAGELEARADGTTWRYRARVSRPLLREAVAITVSSVGKLNELQAFGLPPGSPAQRAAGRDAVRWYSRGCELDLALGCNQLGVMHIDAVGVPEDASAALAAFRRSCELGLAMGCNNLGASYRFGWGTEVDLGQAATLLRGACNHLLPEACNGWGDIAWEDSSPVGFDQAAVAYQTACDLGDPEGCSNLGLLHEEGKGVAEDLSRAADLHEQACGGQHSIGCGRLGLLYLLGMGRKEDVHRAGELLERGCEQGSLVVCHWLAQQLVGGVKLPRDVPRARKLLERACDGGHGDACAELGALKEQHR